jgi:CDP-glucose 4,6-dehydratase
MEQRGGPVEELVAPEASFWADKQVLITGHTGFKGGWLALWLRRLGARVSGFALPADRQSFFAAAGIEALTDTLYGDIREAAVVEQATHRFAPEIVFHLAAQSLVRPSYVDPVETYATNVMGTVNTLAAASRTSSIRAVVVVTSDKCYENREVDVAYREDDPLGGYDPYSSSKACAELVTAAWRQSFSGAGRDCPLGIASARAGNVIGGGDWAEDRLVPDCMRSLTVGEVIGIRSPNAIRPWQHVLEPLCGYLLLAERLWSDPHTYAEAWNFGPAPNDVHPVSWVVSRIVELWGEGASWRNTAGDARHEAALLNVDSAKSRSRLGWSPRLRLDTALDWTVEWYKNVARDGSARQISEDQIARFASISRNPGGQNLA